MDERTRLRRLQVGPLPCGPFMALALALSFLAQTMASQCVPYTPTGELTGPQQAHLAKLHAFANCVILLCGGFGLGPNGYPTSKWPGCPFVPRQQAHGGLYTLPDRTQKIGSTWDRCEFDGSNGQNESQTPGGNGVGVDPGAWTPGPDPRYCPGTGPNAGPGAPPPGGNSQFLDNVYAAAMFYGEMAHQDLGCSYGPDGKPKPGADAKKFAASEARAHARVAAFLRVAIICEPCWPIIAPNGPAAGDRGKLAKKAASFEAAAEDYRRRSL
jgi:hypothetical protein